MSEQQVSQSLAEHDKRISLTEQAVLSIKATNEGITTKLDLLLMQMTKVALLEEKHSNQQADVDRAHDKIDAQGKKLDSLDTEARAFINYTKGVTRVLWALSGAVLILFIKILFFAASKGMTP